MEKEIKICNYSEYPEYYKKIEGTNWSSIVSHLIDITARKVDSYKSDIIYNIRRFTDAVDNGEDVYEYLIFYENGVHTKSSDEDLKEYCLNHSGKDYQYMYRLTYDAKEQVQILQRVYAYIHY